MLARPWTASRLGTRIEQTLARMLGSSSGQLRAGARAAAAAPPCGSLRFAEHAARCPSSAARQRRCCASLAPAATEQADAAQQAAGDGGAKLAQR